MTPHIVFIEPRFPANQKHFIRAFAEIGARVSAIGEGSKSSLDDELKHWLTHYEEVKNVCDEQGVLCAPHISEDLRISALDRLMAGCEGLEIALGRWQERLQDGR